MLCHVSLSKAGIKLKYEQILGFYLSAVLCKSINAAGKRSIQTAICGSLLLKVSRACISFDKFSKRQIFTIFYFVRLQRAIKECFPA